jgi:cytochrome c oxidase subunit II
MSSARGRKTHNALGGAGRARRGTARARRATARAAPLLLALCLAGCGGKQSIVAPRSHQTSLISLLWWWMLGAATVVFFGAIALLVIAWLRRRTPGLPLLGRREDVSAGMVIAFGIVIPVVVLLALFAASDLYVIRFSQAPAADSTSLTVDVVGRQWWWEVRYPGTDAVTANEVHIPIDTRVNVVATTADVIHSLWVPRLARKIDMIPGRENRILFDTPDPGTYIGQCSEFCGLQHAHMRMAVVAESQSAFHSWLTNMARPAPAPTTASQREGESLFMSRGCAGCHELRGSEAQGRIGPDLTHLATRATLAALTIANTPQELSAWIHDPQAIKPGNHMPDLGLDNAEVEKLVSYLESLR